MSKTKITVTSQFGTFSRTTARKYTHVVISNGLHKSYTDMMINSKNTLPENKAAYAAQAEKVANGTAKYGTLGWAGSLDLALKAARKASSPRKMDGIICHANVKVIDVTTGELVVG